MSYRSYVFTPFPCAWLGSSLNPETVYGFNYHSVLICTWQYDFENRLWSVYMYFVYCRLYFRQPLIGLLCRNKIILQCSICLELRKSRQQLAVSFIDCFVRISGHYLPPWHSIWSMKVNVKLNQNVSEINSITPNCCLRYVITHQLGEYFYLRLVNFDIQYSSKCLTIE